MNRTGALQDAAVYEKKIKKRKPFYGNRDNVEFWLMSLPAILLVLIFSYIPMFGLILAFKNYRVDEGILGSAWVGFNNFKFFFTSQDAWRITKNTIGLNTIFIFSGMFCSVAVSFLLFEIKRKFHIKTYQTAMILPNFISWVVVGYMVFAFLNPSMGIMNKTLQMFGFQPIQWYSKPEYWPGILMICSIWKGVGLNAIIFYAGLMGINQEYFEAAAIDGANKFQITMKISLPFITPLIIIMTILAIGGIFRADFGMFYNLTRDAGVLYPTTDVIDTYVYRTLRSLGDVGMSSAIGLYQSVIGFFMILITNAIVRRIEAENALF